MVITQTVDIPASRRITIDVPLEVPTGKVVLIFNPVTVEAKTIKNEETAYSTISKENAVSMTSEIMEKYRPALENLAK
jgi:hypothetical protein